MNFKLLLTGLLLTSLTGCAYLNSVSLTQVPARRNHEIKAQASRFIFFGFNFNNDYVDQAVADLSSQCPSGKVTGILTKDETIMYLSVFAMTKVITASGYCEKTGASL